MLRSENGKVLPEDSKEMTAVVTYLQWISKGIPIYADVPWLGVGKISNNQPGSKENGAAVFAQKCAPCHGGDGQGTTTAPPLWGDKSYNDGAGMATAANLASFALNNMPYKNPSLQPQEAEDVAAFVDGQPRPHFQKKATP